MKVKEPFCSEFEISSFKELLGVLKNFFLILNITLLLEKRPKKFFISKS